MRRVGDDVNGGLIGAVDDCLLGTDDCFGSADGASVGNGNGNGNGNNNGATLGTADGACDGPSNTTGLPDKTPLRRVGDDVNGGLIGAVDDCLLGTDDGFGSADGASVGNGNGNGNNNGATLGTADGACDGPTKTDNGACVGSTDGADVGTPEG